MKALLALAMAVVLGLAGTAQADSITSSFDSDLEGWTGVGGVFTWNATGGSPGGFLSGEDNAPNQMYISAPSAFLGDLSAYDGGTLSFDAINVNDASLVNFGLVRLISGTTVFSLDIAPAGAFTTSWGTVSTQLTAGAWGQTQAAWDSLLGDVTAIEVVLEFSLTTGGVPAEITGFDNFAIRPVPEPSTLALFGMGLVGAAWLRRRRRGLEVKP